MAARLTALVLPLGLDTFAVAAALGALGVQQRLAELASLRGPAVLLLGVSVSLDELAIGFTLGLLHMPVVLVIALIAGQAFLLAQLGLRLGSRLSRRFREGAERLAGLALVGLAVALLAEELL